MPALAGFLTVVACFIWKSHTHLIQVGVSRAPKPESYSAGNRADQMAHQEFIQNGRLLEVTGHALHIQWDLTGDLEHRCSENADECLEAHCNLEGACDLYSAKCLSVLAKEYSAEVDT